MKQSNDPTTEFNGESPGTPHQQLPPVTKERYEELKAQLSEPSLVVEYTPQGTLLNQIRTEHDQKIAAEMAYIQSRLDNRREIKDRFHMSHDGPRGEHLWPRRKM